MNTYKQFAGIKIDTELAGFVEQEVLDGLEETPEQVWTVLSTLLSEFTERNSELLRTRASMQQQINEWLESNGDCFDSTEYEKFLCSIDYMVEEGDDFEITTTDVDTEIASIAGPQLVVPISNARFALNALNARYGSLYDAIYSSDFLLDPLNDNESYSHLRGAKVVGFCRRFLDSIFKLKGGSHSCSLRYFVDGEGLAVVLDDGNVHRLDDPDQFVGFVGEPTNPETIVLANNNLHVLIEIDRNSSIGKIDSAGVKDVVVESAVTTIQDFEDSVAAVDAQDKVVVYRNWLGLMRGNLEATYIKNGREHVRRSASDRMLTTNLGEQIALRTRSLMLCRNVGHLMTNPMVLTSEGNEAYEGIIDGFLSVLIAKHDLSKEAHVANSRTRSIYIVKPKMHGPDEVTFSNDLFSRIEDLLSLSRNTIKIGVMDEERRTSINLKECIRRVKDRVAFINTGFLDRTGDEIHTSIRLGAFAKKSNIKSERWYSAYENGNVEVGLSTGFASRAQIGKGMWAKPDEMRQMGEEKTQHLKDGATTAWVPSPLAASLHALHYHQIDVYKVHERLLDRDKAKLADLLHIPLLANSTNLTAQQIQAELDNNAQGILGYVVRWIDQGIGCSKVPDMSNTNLMEDRATLRISSQHIANWLHHGLVTRSQVRDTLERMAGVVDKQNSEDPSYRPMTADLGTSIAFKAATDLVFDGCDQPNGYTEPLLHRYRALAKKQSTNIYLACD